MHRLKTHLCLCLCIGMLSVGVKADEPTDEQLDELARKHLVYVEPSAAVAIHREDEISPRLDYKDRRGSWGFLLGVGYSNYRPSQYQPNFEEGGYSDWYGGPSSPSVELRLQPKKNLSIGSIGLDLAASYFAASASDGSNLTLTMFEAGFVFNADRIWSNLPYVVPYVEGGAYVFMYNESTEGQDAFKGNSSITPFVAAGLNINLDWADPESAAAMYKQTPLKAFYVYLEERRYFPKDGDPDFSGTFWNAGLRTEF